MEDHVIGGHQSAENEFEKLKMLCPVIMSFGYVMTLFYMA